MNKKWLLILVMLLSGCSNSDEIQEMIREYNAECFASVSLQCVNLKWDIRIEQLDRHISEMNEKRDFLVGRSGINEYRKRYLYLYKEKFNAQLERPTWVASLLMSDDDPYEYNFIPRAEILLKSYQISSAADDWDEIRNEISSELQVEETKVNAREASKVVFESSDLSSINRVAASSNDAYTQKNIIELFHFYQEPYVEEGEYVYADLDALNGLSADEVIEVLRDHYDKVDYISQHE